MQFLENFGVKLEQKITEQEWRNLMVQKMSEGTSSAVYNACDANKRGFVYVFQIAGFIEMVLRTGSVGQYPILSNLDAP